MSERQKRSITAFSLFILFLVCLFLFALTYAVFLESGPLGKNFPGRQFMLLLGSWGVLETALKLLPPAITLGIGYFVRYKLKDWQYYGTLIVAIIGFLSAFALLIEIGAVDTARRFWAYSPVQGLRDFDAFVGAARPALGLILGWLAAVLLIQFGVKRKEEIAP